MGKTISMVSLKGGVGKTFSVVALGSAIASFDKKVLLIDANFSAPNLGLHLDVINPEKTLHHVLCQGANINDAIYNLPDFDILPASLFTKMQMNPLVLKDKIKTLKKKYDFILIDSSPSLDEETLGAMLASDEILIVTTPDIPTLAITLKAIRQAKQRGTPIIGLILNKVHNKNFELSVKEIEETAGVPVMAVVPYDVRVSEAIAKSIPYPVHKPRSEGSDEYKKLAGVLIGEKYRPFRFRYIFRKISPKKQDINREIFYERVFRE